MSVLVSISQHPQQADSPAHAHTPLVPADRTEGFWRDAAPFRAHVGHVMSASGLTAAELAALARVSVRVIRRLIHGRSGRPARRIDPLSARRLLSVSPLEASLVKSRLVPTDRARARLLILVEHERTVAALVRLTGLTAADITRLAAGDLPTCPQIVELRLAVAVSELEARVARRRSHTPATETVERGARIPPVELPSVELPPTELSVAA